MSLLLSTIANLSDVEPGFIRDWIIVCLCLIGGLWMLIKMKQDLGPKEPSKTVISPDPLSICEVERLATRQELRDMEARIGSDIDELRDAMTTDRAAFEEKVVALHTRVNQVVTTTATIDGKLDVVGANVKQVTDHIINRKA